MGAGIEHATPEDRRRIFHLLKVTGTVRHDPEHGIKLAHRNRYSVDWTSLIQLRGSGRDFVNIQTIWIGPAQAAAAAPAQSEREKAAVE